MHFKDIFYSSNSLSPVGILLRIIMIVWAVWGRFGAELACVAAEGMAICF